MRVSIHYTKPFYLLNVIVFHRVLHRNHPECPGRLTSVMTALDRWGLLQRSSFSQVIYVLVMKQHILHSNTYVTMCVLMCFTTIIFSMFIPLSCYNVINIHRSY